jgi:hypothetical protein
LPVVLHLQSGSPVSRSCSPSAFHVKNCPYAISVNLPRAPNKTQGPHCTCPALGHLPACKQGEAWSLPDARAKIIRLKSGGAQTLSSPSLMFAADVY